MYHAVRGGVYECACHVRREHPRGTLAREEHARVARAHKRH
jgi:hypothetical protein